ncbi:hypothetical protein [Leucobacter tenebrionis]|uniref:hypothetical protein n=1 Tax=Leucobacter tenebrionis TaxID=2873270 RepID=UPI001CA67432|nr:hypothetical protein [Leucobacter tenebrionis]QZY52719.1 hypothetical protein KVY00_04525 [Leucobacter tenebrionis]
MSYQGVLGRIRQDSKQKIMAAWSLYGKGYIDRAEFMRLSEGVLGMAGASAAAAADMAVAVELTHMNGTLAASKGVTAERKRKTYLDSLATVLDGDGDVIMKLERLSLNAPLEAAQTAYSDAIAVSDASGWVRQLDPDPCQLCRWWWREGRVWPISHPMPTHSGCECVAMPVKTDYTPRPAVY